MSIPLADHEVVRTVQPHAGRVGELCRRCWAPIPRIPRSAGACNGADDSGRRNLANAVSAVLGEIHVPGTVESDVPRKVECSPARQSAVTRSSTTSCDRRDGAGGADLANPVVAGVAEQDVARGVHGDAVRTVELRCGCRPPIPREPERPGASDGRDSACRIDLANPVVTRITHVEVSCRIDGETLNGVHSCCGCGAAIARSRASGFEIAGERRDLARRVDLANHIRERDVHVACGADRQRVRVHQPGRGCRTTVSPPPRGSSAGERRNCAAAVDLPDATAEVVRHIRVARSVRCHGLRNIQRGTGGRSSVAGRTAYTRTSDCGDVAHGSGCGYRVEPGSGGDKRHCCSNCCSNTTQ